MAAATMDKGVTITRSFAPDVLADILTRLPPNTRRRLRLVCQLWRHVVDTRTSTDLRSRAMTLVVTTGDNAYVFDDLSTARPSWELWPVGTAERYRGMRVVGTRNGLVCLSDSDNHRRGGPITLANPATGATLAIPPLPSPYRGGRREWHRTYSFTYLSMTGRYKIVHVPRCLDRVLVFTLGEASWRDVTVTVGPGPGARCDLDAGIVSAADGKTYLAVEGTEEARIVSFDLADDTFTSITPPLPSVPSRSGGSWGLAEVHGRLAVVASTHASPTLARTEVWAMEPGAPGKWSRWYVLEDHKPRHLHRSLWQPDRQRRLARPHFAHGGEHEHVLTRDVHDSLYVHAPAGGGDTGKARRGVVVVDERNQGTPVRGVGHCYGTTYQQTFVYVETTEPLSVYKRW